MHRALATLMILCSVSCTQRTIEYRRVPAWARQLGATESSFTGQDGREVRWVYDTTDKAFVATGTIGVDGEHIPGAAPAGPREETQDGVALHCTLPMHVVRNLRQCMVEEDYDLIWEQLLAEDQREFYAAGGEEGRAAFERFLTQARKDLVTCLRRMEAGDVFGDVKQEMLDEHRMGIWLHPRVQGEFPIKGIVIVQAADGTLRLHDMIFDPSRRKA